MPSNGAFEQSLHECQLKCHCDEHGEVARSLPSRPKSSISIWTPPVTTQFRMTEDDRK